MSRNTSHSMDAEEDFVSFSWDCTKRYLKILKLEVASGMRISHRHSNSSKFKKKKSKENDTK